MAEDGNVTLPQQPQASEAESPPAAAKTYADALELEALEDSKHLIKFAAENKHDLKKDTVLTLEQARDANDTGDWSSDTAAAFWSAFSELRTCVNPVTIATIYSNVATITRAKWRVRLFNARPITSLSERTARRYMVLLLALLFGAIVLGYAVNSAKSTTEDVNKVLADQVHNVDALRSQIRAYQSKFPLPGRAVAGTDGKATVATLVSADQFPFPADGPEQMLTAIDNMQTLGYQIDQAVNRADAEVSSLMGLLSPLRPEVSKPKPYDLLDRSVVELRSTIDNFYERQSYISRTMPWISGIAQFINFALLPILLGTMGACAYVVRMISDQIKTTTFARTSSIQHAVRVALGALTGVVLGFGGYFVPASGGGTALSTAALSFLAGYAVEPVFALFDKIAQTFRQA